MTSPFRPGRLRRAVVSLGLVAAACGGGGSDQAENTTSTVEATTETTGPSSTSSSAASSSTTAAPATASTTAEPTTSEQQVSVFYGTVDATDCGYVTAHSRSIPAGDDPIEGAFRALVAGPTATEVADGASSFFSAATAESVRSVALDDGLLVVDFENVTAELTNASTSCGSAALLAELNATAFGFPAVERVRYEIEGDCDAFWNWLQRECSTVERGDITTASDAADGSGCTPGSDVLTAGRWFGLVEGASEDELSFDLACWFSGQAAVTAASQDGEESPPPNDYYVRNENEMVRLVPVSGSAAVSWLPDPGDPSSEVVSTYGAWLEQRASRSFQPGVWITIDGAGVVVEIVEQFTP